MEDREIVALFLERSEQAIGELTRKYEKAVRKTTSNILKNPMDAEECVNDALLEVWRTVPPNEPDHLGSYACRLARNIALTRYHSDTAQKRNSHYDAALDELEEMLSAGTSTESKYDAQELSEYINNFLSGQSYDDRYMFVRRCWYADSVSDIAKEMKLTSHAVSVRLFRIRGRLKKYLKREGLIS